MIPNKLRKIADERNHPCVTISLNTHRTHPNSLQDEILLKNLLREAEERVSSQYKQRSVAPLLNRLKTVADKIHRDYLLDSLHLFLSNDTEEIVKLSVPTAENRVEVDETFNIRTLIKAYNRTDEYLILLLSQGGVSLYRAVNELITDEVVNDDFPIEANPYVALNNEEKSDSKHMDDLVREYFNTIDKAVIRLYNEKELPLVVISTESNYARLMQVADRPEVYLGHEPLDYNKTSTHNLGLQGWKVVKREQSLERSSAIQEIEEAISPAKVLTDLQEIYQASLDGRGDLLMIREDFSQAVRMTSDRTFELAEDKNAPDVVDDIVGIIAREVLSRNGRVYFTSQEDLLKIGNIVLKARY